MKASDALDQNVEIGISHTYLSGPVAEVDRVDPAYAYKMLDAFTKAAKEYEDSIKQKKIDEARDENEYLMSIITKVEFHPPYTVVWFNDGEVVKVKLAEDDSWNRTTAILWAIAKWNYFGKTRILNKVLQKWVGDDVCGTYASKSTSEMRSDMYAEKKVEETESDFYYRRGYEEGYEDGYDDAVLDTNCGAVEPAKEA